MEFAGEL